MASGKRPPPNSEALPPQAGRRPRPPTVIDVEATEVPPEPPAAAPAPSADAAPNPDNPAPSEPAQPTPGDSEPIRPQSPPPPPPPPEPRAGNGARRPVWQPALAGAAGGLLVFLALWLGGLLFNAQEPATDVNARLAALERQGSNPAVRPAPAGTELKTTLDGITARLSKLESATASRAPAADPAMASRLAAAEKAAKTLADTTTALSGRVDAAETAQRDLNARVERLNAAVTALQAAARETAGGADRASRLAIVATALRDAVVRGAPFAVELAAVKPLAPAGALNGLEPFAVSGVPTDLALGADLASIVRPMLRAAPPPPQSGGFLDRLQANAERLVRIRPIDETGGDERNAVLSRIVQRAERGNIAGAQAELAKLPPADRASTEAWTAKVQARDKALDASRRLAADAVAALNATP